MQARAAGRAPLRLALTLAAMGTTVLMASSADSRPGMTSGAAPQASFQLTIAPLPVGGSVSGPGLACGSGGTACQISPSSATAVTLAAVAAPGHAFAGWGGDCAGTALETTVQVDGPRTCSAVFASTGAPADGPPYSMTVVPTAGGRVRAAGIHCGIGDALCSVAVNRASTLGMVAEPSPGYTFRYWTGDCAGASDSLWKWLAGPRTCSAVFTRTGGPVPVTYRLTISPIPTGGTVTGNGIACGGGDTACQVTFASSTPVVLTAAPASGFVFAGWGGACTGTALTSEVQVDGTKTCSATFTGSGTPVDGPPYSMTIVPPTGGTVRAAGIVCGAGGAQCHVEVNRASTLGMVAEPSAGYVFRYWTGDCTGTSDSLWVWLRGPLTCSAVFTPPGGTATYQLTIAPRPAGGVVTGSGLTCGTTGSNCQIAFAAATAATLSAVPDAGYTFSGWGGDCLGTSASTTVQVDAVRTCSATFTASGGTPPPGPPYTMTVLPPTGGTVQGAGLNCGLGGAACSVTMPAAMTLGLSATPAGGYTFTGWTGDCSGANRSLWVNLNSSRTCGALFTAAGEPENHVPQITSTPGLTAAVGQPYVYQVSATDLDGDALTFALTASPAGMSIGAATGAIAWTPGAGEAGSHAVTVLVHDGRGGAATQSFAVTVSATPVENRAPVITSMPGLTATAGQAYGYLVTATDGDSDPLTFSLTAAPSGMTIGAATGAITWTPVAGQVGAQAVAVAVSDGRGGAATQSFTVTVSAAPVENRAPLITSTPGVAATSGQAYGYQVVAEDADGDPLTFALTAAPANMTISPATGLISWTPAAAQVGAQAVTVRVGDGRGGSATQSFTVTVSAAANRAPVARAGGPYSGAIDALISFNGSASNDPDGDILSYAWTFGDQSTGTGPSPQHVYAATGSFTVTLTVTDTQGASHASTTTCVIASAPDRAPPMVTLTGPASALPGSRIAVTAVVVDNVGVASVRFEVTGQPPTTAPGPPYELTVDIPSVAAPGDTIQVRAVATDPSSNTGQADHVVTITAVPDTENPTVSLEVPPQTSPGATLRMTASAQDNVGVARVLFLVNGQPAGTDAAPPYEASYAVPAEATVGGTLTVVARAVDFSENASDSQRDVAVAGTADMTPPSVALSAPAEVLAGRPLAITAAASDNVRVASVALSVDGALLQTLTRVPYEATYVVPHTMPAGAILRLAAVATDFSGNEGRATGETRVVAPGVAGAGFVIGEVYDDRTSLPVAGASVEIAGTDAAGLPRYESAVTDGRGRYALAASAGHGVVEIAKAGWMRVQRPIDVTAGLVTEVVDARLTALAAASAAITPVIGGRAGSADAELILAAGGLAEEAALAVTPIGQQGLQGLLPPGWSPVGAADIMPRGVGFPAATLRVRNGLGVAAGATLVFAGWDEAAGAWRALGTSIVPDGAQTLVADVPKSGQYAWLLPDSVPTAPPMPAAGEVLGGVPVAAVPDGAGAAITPEPRIAIYSPGVVSIVRGQLTGAFAFSSGTLVKARISETYRFRSGAEAGPEPFVEDLVFFQAAAAGSSIAASFPVAPSLAFEAASLDRGVIAVELMAPPGLPDLPVVVGPGGTAVVVAAGDRLLQIPAGALTEPAVVAMRELAQAGLGIALPAGLAFIDAVDLSLLRTLGLPATLTIPLPAGLTDASRVLLLRLDQIGTDTRLVVVGAAAIVGSQLVSQTAVGGNPVALEGIRTGGRYLFAQADAAFGFAIGQVLGVAADPFAGAVVSSAASPLVALSGASGHYGLAVPVGTVVLSALDPARFDTGSATGAIVNAGEVVALDLQLEAQVPKVVSIAPAGGASSVPLANPVVITFSEPIDPGTLAGAGAQHVSLSSAAGAVAGTLAVSNGDTVVTFRPVEPLLPNTIYTVTVGAEVRDRSGYAMTAPFASQFTSLDTLPPPTPPAGSIQATVPGADGTTRITASQGTAGPHDTVAVVNTATSATTPVLVDPDGGFTVAVPVGLADTLRLRIADPAGNETFVDVPAFAQTNADGSVSKVIGPDGGRVEGDRGAAVDVAAGTFPDGAVVTVKAVLPEEFPVALPEEAQPFFRLDGGVKVDFGGAEPTRYVNVSLPAAGDEKIDDQWVVSRVAEVNGQPVLDVVDSGKLLGGRIATSSPPCPGVTKQGTYGLYRSNEILGWNYADLSSTNADGVFEARADLAASLMWIPMPWLAIEPPARQPICYPVISGRVTVSLNSVRLTIPGSALTPADREIIIRNQATGTEQHYPRSAGEFVFEMSGSDRDGYRVTATGPAGEQQVRAIGVTSVAPGTVAIRFSPDVVTVPVDQVVVTNLSTGAERVNYVTTEDLTLAADGGEGDAREVTARAVAAGVPVRSVPFTVVPSPYGPGNLVLRALDGTFDPSPPRGAVYLNGMTVPESAIVDGGIAWAFDGSFSDRYVLTVAYPGSNWIVVKIPSFQVTVRNAQTGKVIKTISGQSPPRDQPLSLGVISDDFAAPFVIAGPSRITSFDPAGLISFTFSEPMHAESVKSNFYVQDADGAFVPGEVRISGGNRIATFVPKSPLELGATYTVTLKGNDQLGQLLVPDHPLIGAQGITDPSGNQLPTTRLTIKIFGPRRLAGVPTAAAVNDVAFARRRVGDKLQTFVFAATNSSGTDKVLSIDASDATSPVKAAGNGDQAGARKRITLVPGVSVGGLSSGDLAVTASFNLYYSFLNYYDVTDPVAIRWLGNKLLTATPDFLTPFNTRGTYHIQAFSKGVAALKTADGVYAYAAVQEAGLMAADVGRGIPEPGASTRFLEPMYPGNFVDVTTVYDKLLAVTRGENRVYMFDANLSPLMQFDLPDWPRRVVAVSGFPIDDDGDGSVGPDEVFDLAVIACDQRILIVDLGQMLSGEAAGLPLIGTIPRGAVTREVDLDAGRLRLFAGGDDGLLIIDLSRPRDRADGNDLDGDGVDDRIIWRNPGPRDIGGLKIDADRGVLYVGHAGGVDLWSVYEHCCDLGVDTTAEPRENLVADRRQLLLNEKKALQQAIARGLADAASGCGIGTSSISILEQGSGACLWKGDPTEACTENYQPGISDHDYEVFLPSAEMSSGTCVTKALTEQFRDTDTGEPKPIELPSGAAITFEDISFFPMSKDDFERAKLNVDPPTESGGLEATGDLGLGRQGLLLKWLLEGAYIEVPGHAMSGAPLGAILETLKAETGIPPLEGYEWATLQDVVLAKSRARVRVAGSSDTNSYFYKQYIKQLHDAGKAGIRTALGWMVSDQQANRILLDITREQYETTGCLAIRAQLSDPNAWSEKPCRSFEEYVASAAAKTLRGWTPLPLFTRDIVVQQINRYFRVKSDLEPVASEADANDLIASVVTFIDAAKRATATVFNSTVGQDPDGPQRLQNVTTAVQKRDKALKEARLQPVPHLYNRGFAAGRQLRVALYAEGELVRESRMDLAGGENLYPKYERNPDGTLKRGEDGKPILLFDLGPIDQLAEPGTAKPVAYTIDLPDRRMKEANRQNNVGGFYYYTLDVNSPAPPATPAQPPPPVSPDLLAPDPECDDGPVLKISQKIVAGTQVLDHDAVLGFGEQVTLRITVENVSSDAQSDIVVCSTLSNLCEPVGSLDVGAAKTVEIAFTVPTEGIIADVIATVYGATSGVVTSAPLRLMASCEPYEVIPPDRDPNPEGEGSTVMLGGTALRYLRVVNRRTGEPLVGVSVDVQAKSPARSMLYRFTTDGGGMIVAPDEKGMAIPFVLETDVGQQFVLSVIAVNGIGPSCSSPPDLDVTVTDRAFSRSYSVGNSLKSAISAIAFIKGSVGTGLKLTLDRTVPHPSDTIKFTRSFKLKSTLGIDVAKIGDIGRTPEQDEGGGPGTAAPSSFEFSPSVGYEISKGQSWSSSYKFSYPLDESQRCAMLETALQGVFGLNPLFNRLLDLFRDNPCPHDRVRYLVGTAYSGEVSSTGSIGAGVKSDHLAKPLGINVTASPSAGQTLGFSVGLGRGYEPSDGGGPPAWTTTKESYALNGSLDFSVGLQPDPADPPGAKEDKQSTTELFDRTLKATGTYQVADTYGVEFTRTPGQDEPTSITVSYYGPKGFGWKATALGAAQNNGEGSQDALTWTIEGAENIETAVEKLANLQAIKDSLGAAGASPSLSFVPTVLNQELTTFLDEVQPQMRMSFERNEEFGAGIEQPFTAKLKLGKIFETSLGLEVKADTTVSHRTEAGVNVKGHSYVLEKYKRDSLIPTTFEPLWDLVEEGWDALLERFTDLFSDKVTAVDTSNPSVILQSTGSATMTIDGTKEAAAFDATVFSYHYGSMPGPLADQHRIPASTSGPAGEPHYGIGGFHHFGPDLRRLGAPARLVIDYSDEEVAAFDESSLAIYAYNQEAGDWDLIGGTVDSTANTVTTTVDTMRLYTIGAAMPQGDLSLTTTARESTETDVTFTVTSAQVRLNNGQPVPDGTLFTIRNMIAGGTAADAYGDLLVTDADPIRENLQVASAGGQISFQVRYPKHALSVAGGELVVYSAYGTAYGELVLR